MKQGSRGQYTPLVHRERRRIAVLVRQTSYGLANLLKARDLATGWIHTPHVARFFPSQELRLNFRTTAAICRWSIGALGHEQVDEWA